MAAPRAASARAPRASAAPQPSAGQQRALQSIADAVAQRLPAIALLAPAGSGRSLVAEHAVRRMRTAHGAAQVLDGSRLDRPGLLAAVAEAAGVDIGPGEGFEHTIDAVILALGRGAGRVRHARRIVIDDADRMPAGVAYLLARMAALAPAGRARVCFVLIGGPSLAASLRTLRADAGLPACTVLRLPALALEETRGLVLARLRARRDRRPPPSPAFTLTLHLLARGNPLRVRQLIETSLAATPAGVPLRLRELLVAAARAAGSLPLARLLQALRALAQHRPADAGRAAHPAHQRRLRWASAAAGLALGVLASQYGPTLVMHEVRAHASPTLESVAVTAMPAVEGLVLRAAHTDQSSRVMEVSDMGAGSAAFADPPPVDASPAPSAAASPTATESPESRTPVASPALRAVAGAHGIAWVPIDEPALVPRRAPPTVSTEGLARTAGTAPVARVAPVVEGSAIAPVRPAVVVARIAPAPAGTLVTAKPAGDFERIRQAYGASQVAWSAVGLSNPSRVLAPVQAEAAPVTPGLLATALIDPAGPAPAPGARAVAGWVDSAPAALPTQQAVTEIERARAPVALLAASDAPVPRAAVEVPAGAVRPAVAAPRAPAPAAAASEPASPVRATPPSARAEKKPRGGSDDLARAGDAIALGRNTEAAQLLRKALAADPMNHEVRASLIAVLGERGKDDEWLEALEQAARAAPERFGLMAARGHAELDRLDEAYTLLSRVPAQFRDVQHLSLAGVVLTKMQRYEAALAAYDDALAVVPGDSPRARSLRIARAVVLEHLGRLDEARAIYRTAVDDDPAPSTRAFARSRLASLELER